MKVNLMYLKLYLLVIIFTASSYAQDLIGVIDLNNGRRVNVIMQKSDNTDIHCIEYKSKKKFVIPADKVNSIEFIYEYNFDNFCNEINFNNEVFINFENEMKKYSNFMFVNNNLLNYFYDYLDYVLLSDRFEDSLINYIDILKSSSVSSINAKGLHYECMYRIKIHEFDKAQESVENILNEIDKIYYQALIFNEQKKFKDAMHTVTQMIINHPNDTSWLPPTELLAAKIYLGLGLTNSAINTMKQIKNIYNGTITAKVAGEVSDLLE